MGCQDCHVLDPLSLKEGTFKKITFDEFCAGCHKLSVGSAAAMLNVPHEKTQLVRTFLNCLLYTSPSPRDATLSRMPSSA